MDLSILGRAGYPHRVIAVQGIKGKKMRTVLAALRRVPMAIAAAVRICRRERPDMVMGMGGYAAGPVIVAARLLGIPTAICEQNTVPGLTNRILAPWVSQIFISFPDRTRAFPETKTLFTGNPVRRELVAGNREPIETDKGTPVNLLVVGGSQGAAPLNQAMMDALPTLKALDISVVHQTGPRDADAVSRAYAETGISHTVAAFFHDMKPLYAAADLVICRAGATTVAELALLGKCAVLVPYPFAADDHQTWNARHLSDADAAVLLPQSELSGAVLGELLSSLIQDGKKRRQIGEQARKLAHPDAADLIIDACERLMGSGDA